MQRLCSTQHITQFDRESTVNSIILSSLVTILLTGINQHQYEIKITKQWKHHYCFVLLDSANPAIFCKLYQ